MADIQQILSDLAPGDSASPPFDWQKFEIAQVTSEKDPLFELVYSQLWEEFGTKGELEQREVLANRMSWDSRQRKLGYSLGYEMVVVLNQGSFVAARDHTAIVQFEPIPEVFVHLSHVLIRPEYRGTGMIGGLRSWPIQKARSCLAAAGLPLDSPVTLIAEMESWDRRSLDQIVRLRSYQKAGFRMVDPGSVEYLQPDFRSAAEIDFDGGAKPLALRLIIRRVNREKESEIKGSELKRMVSALYHMYGASFRYKDMLSLWSQLDTSYPPENSSIRLLPPTYIGSVQEGVS